MVLLTPLMQDFYHAKYSITEAQVKGCLNSAALPLCNGGDGKNFFPSSNAIGKRQTAATLSGLAINEGTVMCCVQDGGDGGSPRPQSECFRAREWPKKFKEKTHLAVSQQSSSRDQIREGFFCCSSDHGWSIFKWRLWSLSRWIPFTDCTIMIL